MNSKKLLIIIVLWLLLYSAITIFVAGCAKSPDLSSPEKNHETILYAYQTKNFDLWLKCFQDEDVIRKGFVDISGENHFEEFKTKFFEKYHLLKSTIIKKNKTNESEATLKIKDEIELNMPSEDKYLVKSMYLAKYIKIGNDWKIHSTEKIDAKYFKWIDGKYMPLENNELKE